MKTAAEVKRRPVRCSEEPVAGDGSMCAVSITKRAKLEEPAAADGITRCSPNLLAADGAMGGVAITNKRPRKPEKPPKRDKRSKEGKNKRSKEEKNKRHKQPNQEEVVKHLSMEEEVMSGLAECGKGKKKLVMLEMNQAEMAVDLSHAVFWYMMSNPVVPLQECTIRHMEMGTDDRVFATRKKEMENQANLLRQYRTNGQALRQYQVTDDEREVEEV